MLQTMNLNAISLRCSMVLNPLVVLCITTLVDFFKCVSRGWWSTMVKMGICPECVFGTGEFGVGEHFRRRQVDRMVGWSSSSYLYLYLHSMVWYVRSLCGKHSVELCMAMAMRWRWESVLVSVTKTWTRRKCNWTWSGWKAIKGGTSTPETPQFVPLFFFSLCAWYL